MQNFPKDTISEETVELLEPYFRAEDYVMETALRVCGDVAGLLSWTRAMAFFFHVNKEVMPLKVNLALQEMRLNTAMSELSKAEMILTEKERALDQVELFCLISARIVKITIFDLFGTVSGQVQLKFLLNERPDFSVQLIIYDYFPAKSKYALFS